MNNEDLRHWYKIVLNIVKKKKKIYIVYDANKNIKKLKRLYYILLLKKSWNKLPKRGRTWDAAFP